MVDGHYDCSHLTVKVLTNSIQTTDLSIVNLLARHWLKAFIEFYDDQGDPNRRARFEYYEYQLREGESRLSLHTKLSLLGDEILIGSANADVRSYMMDTNNAMWIRNAKALVRKYNSYLDGLTGDPTRVRQITDSFRKARREDMLSEDRASLRLILTRYGVDRRLDPKQFDRLDTRFVQMLEDVYHLTQSSLSRGKEGTRASEERRQQWQKTFNEKFKAI